MKKLLAFFKTTILGGIFVMLPIVLIFLAFAEAYDMLVLVSTSITDLLFPGHVTESWISILTALGLLVLISFVLGLVMLSGIGPRTVNLIERLILNRIPGYNAIKNLTTSFAGSQENSSFKPGLLVSASSKEFIYIVEEYDDTSYTIMQPWSPTPFVGSIKIVPRDRVESLDINMGKLTEVLGQWGVGSRDILSDVS